MTKALYTGSFDPITNGHLDIIERACAIFDEVYVVMFDNPNKKTIFTAEQRLALIKESLAADHLEHVHVDISDELAVEYAKKVGAKVMVRGLRAATDYEYEATMAYCNQYLDDDIECVFLMSRLSHRFISSSAVKEIASHHHDVSPLVPACVNRALIDYYKEKL